MKINALKPDKRNARKHNVRNIDMIETSLREVGAARSIVVDEKNNILCGNGTVEAAGKIGMNVRIVDTDGTEIIAVRRSNLTSAQKKRLAVLDNRTAEIAEWDGTVLKELSAEIKMDDIFTDAELANLTDVPDELETGEAEEEVNNMYGLMVYFTTEEQRAMAFDEYTAHNILVKYDK